MLNQIRYTLIRFFKNPIIYLIAIVQITAALYLINSVLLYANMITERQDKINSIVKNGNELFYFRDQTDEKQLFNNELDSNSLDLRMENFYNFLAYNKNFKFVTCNNRIIQIKNFKGNSKMLKNEYMNFPDRSYNGLNYLNALFISSNFFDEFNIFMDKGNKFQKNDSCLKPNVKIILGYSYKKLYNINDKIDLLVDSNEIKCTVNGFLKRDSYFVTKSGLSSITKLDNCILLPVDIKIKTINNSQISTGIFDMFITHSFLVTNNSKNALNIISQKNKELNLYDFKLKNFSESINESRKEIEQNMKYTFLQFCIVFLFCSIGIIFSFLNSIDRRINEFGIHLMSGCKINDIAIRIALEIFFIMLFSLLILNLLIDSFSKYILPALICMYLFILLLPLIKVKRYEISMLIRRKE